MELTHLIETVGYLGLFGIVFAESGLLVGFFLPGDSLLFTAGILAAQGFFNFPVLLLVLFLAATTGDSVGYSFGHRVGRRLFTKKSFLFHHENLEKAEKFYESHGKITIVLARFIPIIRTFAPVVAGIGKMDYRTFLAYNLIGGALWTIGVTSLGYYLGNLIPDVERYIIPFIVLVVIGSFVPPIYHIFQDKTQREAIFAWVKKKFKRA